MQKQEERKALARHIKSDLRKQTALAKAAAKADKANAKAKAKAAAKAAKAAKPKAKPAYPKRQLAQVSDDHELLTNTIYHCGTDRMELCGYFAIAPTRKVHIVSMKCPKSTPEQCKQVGEYCKPMVESGGCTKACVKKSFQDELAALAGQQ